jgi:hypothetical protein
LTKILTFLELVAAIDVVWQMLDQKQDAIVEVGVQAYAKPIHSLL